ncbi:MAG: AraC family transcriptional regulator [Bacteroidota bacterium]
MNKDILAEFNKVLIKYYTSDMPMKNGVLTVKEYAGQLNLSENYMGDLLKMETGRSAKDHIREYVIEKAKTRLLGSNESVSEIAYILGFEYPQGLNKLFKAKVGMSPTEYRTLN